MRPDLRAALAPRLAGPLTGPGDAGYDDVRRVWNRRVDRRPAAVAACAGAADVATAVRVAAELRIDVSVRGGGHQVAGGAICPGGLVIDVSALRGVRVDRARRTVRVGGGALWGELDRATRAAGLVAPGGDTAGTGVAGLALGGGIGLLTRAYGLTAGSLRRIELVTADGRLRHAGPDEHPDLFWAARGGGRGLGVVTALEFGLHPIGDVVAVADVYYPAERADRVVRAWRDAMKEAPGSVSPMLVLRSRHGRPVVGVGAVFAGPPEHAGPALAPLRDLDEPAHDASGVVPYALAESPPGRAYMNSHLLDDLTDDAIGALLDAGDRRVGAGSAIVLRTLGGAADDLDGAWPHRGARFALTVHATWPDAAGDGPLLGWCRETWAALAPYGNGGVYLNFPGDPDEAGAAAFYRGSAERLRGIRSRYDPAGVFAYAAGQP